MEDHEVHHEGIVRSFPFSTSLLFGIIFFSFLALWHFNIFPCSLSGLIYPVRMFPLGSGMTGSCYAMLRLGKEVGGMEWNW